MTVFLICFVLMIILGAPIAFSLGISSVAYVIYNPDLSMLFIVQKMFTGTDSFPLLAIPFFILAGNLMNMGGVTRKLLNFCNLLVGHWRGGLASVSIVGSMIFAGISGSSVADASGLGSILIPAMNDSGYDKEYSVAINATSSTVGILIPPSIPMVLLASIANASVRDMFFSTAVAGVMIGLGMLVLNAFISKRKQYPRNERVKLQDIPGILFYSIPALIMPAIIILGIIFGVVTATEAAVLAVVYSLVVGKFVYRELTLKTVYEAMKETVIQTAVVLFIIATASILSGILSYLLLPQALAVWAVNSLQSKTLILAFIAILALFTGLFIDVTPALILLGAIFAPVATAAGISMLHFGTVLVTALAIGLFTPPVGTTLIISSYIAKTSIADGFRYCLPFMALMLGILLLLVLFPIFSVGLPTLMFY
ncbi:MAG: TRAP transporter large permease [Sphaerochaeta sp.]|nr:TRAP transporter large permease [Sphaerochaeta sp.]